MRTRAILVLAATTLLVGGPMSRMAVTARAAQPGEIKVFDDHGLGGPDGLLATTSNSQGDAIASGDGAATDPDSMPLDSWDFVDGTLPRWSGRIGAVILQRGRLASAPLVLGTSGGTPNDLVNAKDINLPISGGIDVGLIRRGEYADVEWRYFGIEQGSASLGSAPQLAGPFITLPGNIPFGLPVNLGVSYGTQLDSFEANLRHNLTPRWSILGGFRYVYFRDQLAMTAAMPFPPGSSIRMDFDGNNNLFGGQIGADGILWDNGGRFSIESAIKAGVYGNMAQNSVSIDSSNPANNVQDKTSASHTAFVGDLSFTGVYQFNDQWSLRAGYQLLWLAGVAVAADQAADSFQSTATVDTSGNAFFHGALVGVERNW
jgi:hypothetical protein